MTELVASVNADCGFQRKISIYMAEDRNSAKLLADEARARRAIGLDVTYHNEKSVSAKFGLKGVAALSSQQAASCDPYQLAHALLQDATANGAEVYERTAITEYECNEIGIRLQSDRGPVVAARYAVIANGYESQKMLKEKVVNLDNTYALVSEPLQSVSPWNTDWMLWQAKEPYLYLRITDDNRLLVGGEDDAFHSPKRRDASIATKANTIEEKVRELIPDLEWEREFAWAGTFGKTKDGLAYIGPTEEYANCLFALGFGGNGITFSSIATNLIADMVQGQNPDSADLFRFVR